jgi:hypothetical protein
MKEYKFSYKSTLGRRIIIHQWLILYNYIPNILFWLWFFFIFAVSVNFTPTIYAEMGYPVYEKIIQVVSLGFMTTIFSLFLIETINMILILLNLRSINEYAEDILKEDKIISKIGNKTLEFNYDSITNVRSLGKHIFTRVRQVPGLSLVFYIENSQLREEVLDFLKSKTDTKTK